MLLPTGKSKSPKSFEFWPSFGYFSITTEEYISYLTALLEAHLVPQNKLGVTKEKHEGEQELPRHVGTGSDTSKAYVLAFSLDVYSQVYRQSKYESTQVLGGVCLGIIHK